MRPFSTPLLGSPAVWVEFQHSNVGRPVSEPEFRCLICDKAFAEGADPALPRETCGQCGKAILSQTASTTLPVAEIVPLVRPAEVPVVQTVKPPPIPETFPKARIVSPTIPTRFSPKAETVDIEPPRPKLAFALFVAFLTLIAIMASLTVIGYTIVTGLKQAAKRVEAVPTVRATVPTTPGK